MYAVVTGHAQSRLKSRSGLNKKSLERIANKALSEGIKHSQVKGNLKKYIDKLYLSHRTANNIRIYGDKVYLFDENRLITVIQIPSNLTKNMKQMITV